MQGIGQTNPVKNEGIGKFSKAGNGIGKFRPQGNAEVKRPSVQPEEK